MSMNSTYPTSLADGAANENWARYLYGKDRGHVDYLPHAARCEGQTSSGAGVHCPVSGSSLCLGHMVRSASI